MQSEMKFTHFRLHSEYSFEKSIVNLDLIIKKIICDKQKSICITDTNNIFNSIYFYKECLKNNIKPIIGCDLNLEIKKKIYNIILVVKNKNSFLNISKLLSKFIIYEKNIKLNLFNGELKKDVIIILNLNNKIFYNLKVIKKNIKKIKKIFKKNFYLEIQKFKENKNYKNIINLSKTFKTPLLATNPIYFNNKNDFKYCKAKVSIYKNNYFIKNIRKNNYFYTKKEMLNLFKDLKKSLNNTFYLSKKCNFRINFNKIKLPFLKIKKKYNNNLYILKKLLKKIKRLKLNYLYKERLLNELKIIFDMNLSDYFLIVSDFVRWAKKKNINVGPGRGSSAGSLVSFLLNITIIDPIKNNLLFERFLNSERISIPDFDIDFCQEERENVLKYIKKKYGICFVSQIITFNKLCSKSAIKDIGKFLNFNYDFINEINKIISINENLNILEILRKNKDFYYKYKKNKNIKNLISIYERIEGLPKTIGIHSGGVLISPNKIYNYMPLSKQNKNIISHYYKDDLENLGILKFDFLGLATLTIIKNCIKNIDKKIILKNINLEDDLCYYNLRRGNTICVFQLESFGIRNVLKKIKPDCFNNIIAIISLYRPGPIKLIKDFYLRKSGKKKIIYIDENLEKILEETYGIIVYQEQIMQIVKIMGNYSLNEADNLRKIISKKQKSNMILEKKIFIKKCLKNNIDYKKSVLIFNMIKEFANYGFNKSHATAYALLSYYTLWLKSYYIEFFMAANMSYYYNDINKLKLFINDSLNNNIYILPIDINFSDKNFKTIKSINKKIRYGFKGLYGLGVNIIDSILKVRINGYFKNFLDFYERVDKKIVNYKSLEILIGAGSFDSLNQNRGNLIKKLKYLFKKNFKKNIDYLIKNIYFKKNYYWNFKIKIIEEKIIIGFFLLNNIYNIYKKRFNKSNLNNYENGIIIKIKDKIINNNFTIFIINKKQSVLEIKINKNLFKKKINLIKKYNFLIIKEKVYNNLKNYEKKIIIADNLMNI
ncbi:DNA polymerase III alpha subunit [Candidatus Nasuia deltocephalinicola]|uniref:DNA polymerase III subunit alpha n=1 Tax=Candidatus Nasuia deltocephalincola TaxID=1160784 RepID=A0A0S2UPC5_9PROT|nr:DNA polymerase III alpha subunit [Candidatus Nasuia deltocephalinicola]